MEETRLFDEVNSTEEHINLTSAIIDKVQLENTSLNQTSYYNAVLTLYKWIKRVLHKIFETSVERQSTLNSTCAVASVFLTYLSPYTYGFWRLMLIVH
ncbi:unnamed protein product [Adineta steineri]|uniref:Uncharacterized protein n=1 Tax=Adineta steineri TaxID=433720 RepID=A0A815KZZ3_9BILA|nr:unnamed protein product [Adineta steineri]CAF4047481.1 unnamed protein product [Adineta steineri]